MVNILITGGTGFIGQYLLKEIKKKSRYNISLIVRKKNIAIENKNIATYYYNGDLKKLNKIFIKSKPDIVIHLATCYIFDHQPFEIEKLINSNILFGCQILEVMRLNKCKNIINFGTYFQKYRSQSYNPVNLYASTKQSFENILMYYNKIHNINAITLTLFDTFGFNDKRNKIIKKLLTNVNKKTTLNLNSKNSVIDIINVVNVVNIIIKTAKYLHNSKNIIYKNYYVTGYRIKLSKLITLIEELTKSKLNINYLEDPKRINFYKLIKISKDMKTPWHKEYILNNFKKDILKLYKTL